ncbi:MAG: HIT family protein [Candidatus Shapirobacteria bacterium]
MNNCIFCQIATNQTPHYRLYEDAHFFAMLDIRPLNPGHTLIIPKTHYCWVDDVPNFGTYFEFAKKIGQAIHQAFNPITIYYLTLGFDVPHAHIHLVPRFENDGHENERLPKTPKNISPEEMRVIQEKIKACI